MRKLITLIAAAALVASPFAFAEDATQNTNPNDVLQTVPDQPTGPTVADNSSDTTAPSTASAGDSTPNDQAATSAAKPKHKKHTKHHHKHHHKKSTAPSSDTHTSKEEPNSASGTDMSAPSATPGQ